MQRLAPPPSARFFFAVMTPAEKVLPGVEQAIEERYGPLSARSPFYLFSRFSPYYDQEMGGSVWKYFVALQDLMPADRLVEVKQFAERLQEESMGQTPAAPGRTVNLDPGYVTPWQVVLSTVKNRSHRIYLGGGVYAELTLLYHRKRFEPLPWTYPDYRQPLVLEFFQQIRPTGDPRREGDPGEAADNPGLFR